MAVTKKTWARVFRADPAKAAFARELTSRMTRAERALWREFQKVNTGSKKRPVCPWKPQVVIKGWIVDFYNPYTLMAIEVDGGIHDTSEQKAKDELKDSVLRHFGIRVVRVRNEEVLRSPTAVFRRIMGYE